MMRKVLFVGLGRMGSPMAGYIAKSRKFDVSVFNRSQTKVEQWLGKYEGSIFSPEDLPEESPKNQFDFIALCIGNDEDVRSTLTGSTDLIGKVKAGGTIIDHTTTSAGLAQQMYAAANERGIGYLDAPVSGGETGAINGQLSCMIGGDAGHVSGVVPILSTYCKGMTHIGESGSGQIAKMANQFCIAGTLAGLSEAIKLLEKGNIDTKRAFQAIKSGAAQSWQMDNRFATMTQREFDFGFATDHMIKDLKYALQLADQQQWEPKVSKQVLQWYELLSEEGHGSHDTSCLVEYYKK